MRTSSPGPVSRRQFAKMLGVTESAVRSAIKDNRINVLPDGQIDPVAARASWAGKTDPSRSRVRTTGKVRTQGAQEGAHSSAQVKTEKDAREAITLIARILSEEGMQDDGKGVDFGKVRTAELILKARQRELDQAEQAGKLVDRALAEKLFFDTARENRDAWQSWPGRIAITMADELNVDARALTTILTTYVRQHLVEMGEPEAGPLRQ